MDNSVVILRKLVDRAFVGVEDLPAKDQRELNEAAAMIFQTVDPERAKQAAHIVALFREGERQQIKFQELLRQ